MAEKSSNFAKGGVLLGVAAIITAVVPLFTNQADEKAERADDKAELVMELIKQHLEFQGQQIDEVKRDTRDLRRFLRYMYTKGEWLEEGAYEPAPPPPPAPSTAGIGGGGGSGMGFGGGIGILSSLGRDDDVPVPEDIGEIIEEPPEEPPIQAQAPLPSPKELDSLLSKKAM
jgi:hypothetical protein